MKLPGCSNGTGRLHVYHLGGSNGDGKGSGILKLASAIGRERPSVRHVRKKLAKNKFGKPFFAKILGIKASRMVSTLR